MKKLISGIVAVAMALSLAACEKETKVISLSGKTMGTTYHVKYLDEDGKEYTTEAAQIVFGCGFNGNECEIIDEEGQVIYCDTSALLEIRLV